MDSEAHAVGEFVVEVIEQGAEAFESLPGVPWEVRAKPGSYVLLTTTGGPVVEYWHWPIVAALEASGDPELRRRIVEEGVRHVRARFSPPVPS